MLPILRKVTKMEIKFGEFSYKWIIKAVDMDKLPKSVKRDQPRTQGRFESPHSGGVGGGKGENAEVKGNPQGEVKEKKARRKSS